ncbi:MAG: GHKL domain-containing protein [Cytophagales bacterium]|nr:MAG: GHKL domain-containing protein [Cytophagales bacterium]
MKYFLFIIVFISNFLCYAKDYRDIVVTFNEQTSDFPFYYTTRFVEDAKGELDITKISDPSFQSHFTKKHNEITWDENKSYWAKITIIWNTRKDFVFFTPFLLKRMELYYPTSQGYKCKYSGVDTKFSDKEFKTSVPVVSLPHQLENNKIVYYIKLKVYQNPGDLIAKPLLTFVNHELYKYLLHGLLFGIILVAAFYNFILFVKLKEYAYLYYSLYVVAFAFFSSMTWYYQTNFLWWAGLNKENILDLYNIPFTLISIFFLLYAKSFFHVKNRNSVLDNYFSYLIAIRILCYLIGKFLFDAMRSPWVDIIILLPVFYIGVFTYLKRFQPAKNFLIAFAALYIGILIHGLKIDITLGSIDLDQKTLFMIFGCMGMFLFSLSLGDRLQLVGEEKDKAKNELINQMKKNETYKDQITQSLEQKVSERTKELEERNKQLDTFIYRASHDIKGPLKSMLGLAQLGLLETKEEIAQGYFEHIFKSSKRLDDTLADLLNVVKTNHFEIERTRIDFHMLFTEITSSFEYHPNFKNIRFDFIIPKIMFFESDRRLIYSVLQNLIENGINYCDTQKQDSYIQLRIEPTSEKLNIIYEDNGIGIAEEYNSKIFDMFFKINAQSTGTGLGMYIVKTTLERLGATISMESKEGIGTKFMIIFEA